MYLSSDFSRRILKGDPWNVISINDYFDLQIYSEKANFDILEF